MLGVMEEHRWWRSVARWALRRPFEVATFLGATLVVAHWTHLLSWQVDSGTILIVVAVLYGLGFVAWKWFEEERGFRAERRRRPAD